MEQKLLTEIQQQKKELRGQMLKARGALPKDEKAVHDAFIRRRLSVLIQEADAQVVHSYLPMGSEVDVFPLLEELLQKGIIIIAPKTLKKRQLLNLQLTATSAIEEGLWGTIHPAGNMEYSGPIDFFIVPGLAFDRERYRLGYGAGYYDNHLVLHPNAKTVAVCYPFQIVDHVPVEPHDMQLDEIIMPFP